MSTKNPDLLTVREFAEAAKVSRQTVYRRMGQDLSQYVTEVDGVKHLERTGLWVMLRSPEVSQIDKGVTENVTPCDSEIVGELRERIRQLEADKERLYSLLEEKEKTLQQAQALHLNTQVPMLGDAVDPDDPGEEKKGILGRIFRRR